MSTQPAVSLPELNQGAIAECTYKTLLLGEVTTVSEAALLFGKGKTTIHTAVHKHKLECRQSLTGGTILITVRSLIKLWGAPKIDLETFYVGKGKAKANGSSN